ncbi:MAG: restriction endonuclease subunit M [Treponema sp.]|nr:restriction endonuclease subunit M [Treponema sp.]
MEQNKKQTEKTFSAQTKSKERVRQHGEVFTAEREVKAMCDLVKDETERIDSRFLEPACGDGNFLAEILSRKLAVVKRKYGRSHLDYEKNAVLAASSIYGVDILLDNVIACRERMFTLWDKEYKAVCKKDCNEQTREAVQFILSRNIVCGNALTLKCVDENANDTDEPIIFSEWAFVTASQLQRSDYTFDELLAQSDGTPKTKQRSLFDDTVDEGIFLKKYITHYRRVQENG